MDTVDLLGLAVPVTYFVFYATERLWPARAFPPRKGWAWIGIAFLLLISTVGVVLPLLIPEEWLPAAVGSASECARRTLDQFAAGADGVILHGSSPAELEPVVDAYRTVRPSGRFDARSANPAR